MPQFTGQQRTFMVLEYAKTNSPTVVIERFRVRFPDRQPPTRQTILRNVLKYEIHHTSLNRNKGNSGRRRTARSQENVAAVRQMLLTAHCVMSTEPNWTVSFIFLSHHSWDEVGLSTVPFVHSATLVFVLLWTHWVKHLVCSHVWSNQNKNFKSSNWHLNLRPCKFIAQNLS